MRGITLAWAVGLALMTWRTAQEFHRPPVPGRILGASMVFAALALLAEYEPAARAAVLAAWGFDVAVLFQIGPAALVSTAGFGGNAVGGSSGPAGEGGSAAGEGSGGKIKGG